MAGAGSCRGDGSDASLQVLCYVSVVAVSNWEKRGFDSPLPPGKVAAAGGGMSGEVVHEPHLHRFSLELPEVSEVAILQYHQLEGSDGTVLDLVHTYCPPAMRGQGVAAKLVSFACEYARSSNLKIIPTCSYIPVYLSRHPNDMDVVKMD